MSTPQWPHTRINLFERTRQSATRRCDDTSWEEASEFLCIKTLPFLREFSNNKIRQNSQECSLWRATNVRFSIFAASAEKEKPCCTRFFENALRAVLIDQLIQVQRFWEVVCFTGHAVTARHAWQTNTSVLLKCEFLFLVVRCDCILCVNWFVSVRELICVTSVIFNQWSLTIIF